MNTVRRARIRDAIEHSAFAESSRYAVASLEEACEFLSGASGALEKVHV